MRVLLLIIYLIKYGDSTGVDRQNRRYLSEVNTYVYPQSNASVKHIHRQLWLKYYECLKEKYVEAWPVKTLFSTALTALVGTRVTLTCQICVSPVETYMLKMIQWHFNSSNDKTIFNEPLLNTDSTLISSDNKRIVIYSIQEEHAGKYWCKMKDTMAEPYYLHIDSESKRINIAYPGMPNQMSQSRSSEIISRYNLKIYTAWTRWSSCSTCGTIGRKTRYGYCTISLLRDFAHRYIANESAFVALNQSYLRYQDTQEKNIYSWKNGASDKMDIDGSMSLRLESILLVFKNKMPCRSNYIPKPIQDIVNIKKRKTEVMFRYCKRKCTGNVIFEIRDKGGNILESANNSMNIYSMVQEVSVPMSSVFRTTVYKMQNKEVIFSCLRNMKSDAQIIWHVGSKVLHPYLIKQQSQGRIQINLRMQIVFKQLKYEDTNVYSCWCDDELIATIKLIVTHEMELKLNRYIVMISGIIIIVMLLFIFWRASQRRSRFTIH